MTGAPLLVVDLDVRAAAPSESELDAAGGRLAQLACPSVALIRESPSAPAARLRPRFDAVVAGEAELEAIATACEGTPLAAAAAAQLLRHSEGLGIHEGLIAESLVYSTLQGGPEFAAWLAARPAPRRRPADDAPAVLVSRHGDRLELELNRPRKRNAFSAEMRDALCEALQIPLCDVSIQEIVLRGAGPAFCSGGDLDEFGTLPDPATAHAIRSTRNASRLLAGCGARVRAHVHGACVGAGVELPAFAARVTARKDTFFQLPEVALGLVPGAGGTVSIPRRIGRQRTAWMALSGARVDADTALRWGLVDEIAG